jgi:hypothetical protein
VGRGWVEGRGTWSIRSATRRDGTASVPWTSHLGGEPMGARRPVGPMAGCRGVQRGGHGGLGRRRGGCRAKAAPWVRPDHSTVTDDHVSARSAAERSPRRPVLVRAHRTLLHCGRFLPVQSRSWPVRARRPVGASARQAARPAAPWCAPRAECTAVPTRQTSTRTVTACTHAVAACRPVVLRPG